MINSARNIVRLVAVVVALSGLAGLANAQNAVVPQGPQAGQKVAFMGDSITAFGMAPGGYVSLVALAMDKAGRKIIVIPAGVSGNTSKDMLARLHDVIDKKPDWMTLSCGVNDVWHGAKGVPLDQYKANITSIIDQATAAGIKVYVLTATMIMEDPNNALNKQLVAYNEFLRGLAKARNLPLVDLNADMQAELAPEKAEMPGIQGNVLTVDGVHPNGLGNEMMATGIVKAFGMSDAQLAQAKAAWMDLPTGAPTTLKTFMSVRDYLALLKAAAAQKTSVDAMLSADLAKAAKADEDAAPAGATPKP